MSENNLPEEGLEPVQMNSVSNTAEKNKSGGKGLALLAILISLGMGAAGYYYGQQQMTQLQQKIESFNQQTSVTTVEVPDLSKELTKLNELAQSVQINQTHLTQIETILAQKQQVISALQAQVNKLDSSKPEQPTDWLLSEADFLLNNALRKLILDNDVDTSISLLKVADEILEKVADARVIPVRTAINNDLKQLLALNNVDQNAIMQRLSQLANSLDELSVLNVNFGDNESNANELTDSVLDWKSNIEKSTVSFLDHFIRISPRNNTDIKPLLAPNQDIYLRENIRLRLQIAILAVPRQQDELYKQSLEAVSSWVRSYFDTNTEAAQTFLKEIDELSEQSIYVDVPSQLNSLKVLDELLNRQSSEVKKIEIAVDKTLAQEAEADKKPDITTEQPAPSNEKMPEAQPNPENTPAPAKTEQ